MGPDKFGWRSHHAGARRVGNIPDLEFLTLGDAASALCPSNRISITALKLSGDVYAAMSQIEEFFGQESSPEAVLDAVVFPALKLAARDRRGRLDTEFMEELESTIEYVFCAILYVSKMPHEAEAAVRSDNAAI